LQVLELDHQGRLNRVSELFLYPGDRHLFADDGLPDYDETPRRCSSNAC
jgi:hypothetical protein